MGVLPVVLHHGLFGYDSFGIGKFRWAYFQGIDKALRKSGHPVVVTRVHPTGGIARRAGELKESLLQSLADLGLTPRTRVLIVAHSLGGLDARYMVHKLGMADRVAGILTITTPHRGSPYANWCARHLGKRLGGFELMELLGLDVQAIRDLTTESCAAFNEEITDVPGVGYFSVTAAREWRKVAPWVLHSHQIVYEAEGDNDGLVSIRSGTWGTHLETWRADHFHTINKRFVIEIRNRTGNIAPYYVRAVSQVMERLGVNGGGEGDKQTKGQRDQEKSGRGR